MSAMSESVCATGSRDTRGESGEKTKMGREGRGERDAD